MILPSTIYGAPTGDVAAGIGAATDVAGGIIGAIGAQQAGAAQARGYMNNMQIVGDQTAQELYQFGRTRVAQLYNQNRVLGTQRARYGAAGVEAGAGSPLDVMGDTANQIKVQALNLAYAQKFAQASAAQQGQADLEAAQAAHSAGQTGFFGQLINGIGSAAKLLLTG